MAKKNNKGFSLVEVVIGIAILTLLLTPVLRQLTATLNTSRKAKEQQYANENAEYLVEYMQSVNLEDIPDSTAGGEVNYTSNTSSTVNCNVSVFGSSDTTTVSYNVNNYEMNPVTLGARQTEYSRNVKLDDLSLMLMSGGASNGKSYAIAYNLSDDDAESYIDLGYTRTNEGSLVRYDSNGCVNDVVCRETTAAISNPNDVNLGNMQDLDASKVAIIAGTSSNFDSIADQSFYSKKMNNLKNLDYDAWENAINHVDGENVFSSEAFDNSLERAIKILIKHVDAVGDEQAYYLVSAAVYYQSSYIITVNGTSHSYTDELNYNIFSQKFYTDEQPAIYMEYQPYTIDTDDSGIGNQVRYAEDDTIYIENYVEGSKIYLYKPVKDQATVTTGGIGSRVVTDANGLDEYVYLSSTIGNNPTSEAVNIHVNSIRPSGTDLFRSDIYTNLYTVMDSTSDNNCMFTTAPYMSVMDATIKDIQGYIYSDSLSYSVNGYSNIHKLSEDERFDSRLYTITVTLTPDNSGSNTIRLCGAKGD